MKTLIRVISEIGLVLGVLLFLGAIGGADRGLIDCKTLFIRSGVAILVIAVSYITEEVIECLR